MWTNENRGRYDRSRLRYPSDLTDDEWNLVESLIPPGKRGGGEPKRNVERVHSDSLAEPATKHKQSRIDLGGRANRALMSPPLAKSTAGDKTAKAMRR